MSEQLNWKDRGSLALEASIASIPYVGSALQTAYFGAKNEKRFKRIESFYNELSADVTKLGDTMASVHDLQIVSDELSDFMESTNGIIESQSSQTKRAMLHNAFLRVLVAPNGTDWSETKFFVSTINQVDLVDLQLLLSIGRLPADKWATMQSIDEYLNLDHFYTVGVTERLVNFGYLEKRFGSIHMQEDGTVIDAYYRITNLGTHFLAFATKPPVANSSTDKQ